MHKGGGDDSCELMGIFHKKIRLFHKHKGKMTLQENHFVLCKKFIIINLNVVGVFFYYNCRSISINLLKPPCVSNGLIYLILFSL